MNPTSALHQLGTSRQKLLRTLMLAPQGASVETLCEALHVTQNAVRQHLTALLRAGFVEHGAAHPTGGRPQSRYLLTASGRELFPRNYGLIATGILEHLYAHADKAAVQSMLADMGQELGKAAAERVNTAGSDEIATVLAEQLDALGYEALPVRHGEEMQLEAYNCVFHALAKAHPDVCRFDLAFMEAATGHSIQHMECLVRGGQSCRFRIGKPITPKT